MTDYGVQPTGFVRKPLTVIKQELEARNQTEFGSDVIQTPQSPLGQINGIMAELSSKMWELAEAVYQSYDPDQATGYRLETLGRIRLINRSASQSDEDYRKSITNAGAARVDVQDVTRAIAGISGVTYSQVFINDKADVDDNGMPGGSLSVAVTGGDDNAIAVALRSYVAPGIILHGNYSIESVIEGYCRSFRIIRPIEVPVDIILKVRTFRDPLGCPPPALTVIGDTLVNGLYLINGDDIDFFRIRAVLESAFNGVEVISFQGQRDGEWSSVNIPIEIGFEERAVINNIWVVL